MLGREPLLLPGHGQAGQGVERRGQLLTALVDRVGRAVTVDRLADPNLPDLLGGADFLHRPHRGDYQIKFDGRR